MHGKTTAAGCNGQQQNQNTHTTQPVAEAAPVEQSFGKTLHTGKNGCTGSSEAGYDFKQCIYVPGNLSGQEERQCTQKTEHYPTEAGTDHAIGRPKALGAFSA